MKMITHMKDLGNKLSSSFKRFPMALILAALAVGIAIFMNHRPIPFGETREMYARMIMVLALGIPLYLSLYVFFEGKINNSKEIRRVAYFAGAILLVFYYFFILTNIKMLTVTRYIAHTLALYLTFSFIPYFQRKENYELYVIKLFTRFVVTYLYSVVLYLGLAAILETIKVLFNAGISEKVFFDILVIVVGIFAPAFFLADVPRRNEEIPLESYPKVLNVLLQFIILPLLGVYTLILYIYFGQTLLTKELPRGIIGNLVLWYSIVSTIALFFIDPLRKINQWINRFVAVFPKAIIPLLGMMFVALGIRISAYGVTESRYFVLVVGLWVTGVMLYYALKKKIVNIFLPISLTVVALLAVMGPWSAYSVSQFSQNKRFEEILTRYDMIDKEGQIKNPEREFVAVDKMEISEIILYFNRYHGLEDIKYLPENFEVKDMKGVFGFELHDIGPGAYLEREYFSHYVEKRGNIIDIKGYDYFGEHTLYQHENIQQIRENHHITYDPTRKELLIKRQEEVIYTMNVGQVAMDLHRENRGKDLLQGDSMLFFDENQSVKLQLIFNHISGFENRLTDEINIEAIEFYFLIKFK